MKKRERLEVVFDILCSIRDNRKIKPTRLLYSSNLSSVMFKEYIVELIQNNLIEEVLEKKVRKYYIITDKGCDFINKYSIFADFVSNLGL